MTITRPTAAAWAISMATRPDVVYLDTETTGLDGTAEIVDLAVVDNAGRVLVNTLVRPGHAIPADATRIHHITDQMVAAAPGWPQVYPALAGVLRRFPCVVVYNAPFDVRMLRQSSRSHALPDLEAEWHCAMRRYAEFASEQEASWGGSRWQRLGVAAERLGVPPSATTHRALDDSRTCREVVHAMARRAAYPAD
ncbi:MAG TPA: 3'-5' exonuclease [Thermomicrobiaceae bacterium]|nr:3'-5' exonuclease [Thermomicrobiaceae bacterium]